MRGENPKSVWWGRLLMVAVVLAGAVALGGCKAPPPAAEPEPAGPADTEVTAEVETEELAEPEAEPEETAEPQAEPEPEPAAETAEPEPEPEPVAPKPTVAPAPAQPPAATTTTERTGEIPADHIKDRDGVYKSYVGGNSINDYKRHHRVRQGHRLLRHEQHVQVLHYGYERRDLRDRHQRFH